MPGRGGGGFGGGGGLLGAIGSTLPSREHIVLGIARNIGGLITGKPVRGRRRGRRGSSNTTLLEFEAQTNAEISEMLVRLLENLLGRFRLYTPQHHAWLTHSWIATIRRKPSKKRPNLRRASAVQALARDQKKAIQNVRARFDVDKHTDLLLSSITPYAALINRGISRRGARPPKRAYRRGFVQRGINDAIDETIAEFRGTK